jgi:hypothetical protein
MSRCTKSCFGGSARFEQALEENGWNQQILTTSHFLNIHRLAQAVLRRAQASDQMEQSNVELHICR